MAEKVREVMIPKFVKVMHDEPLNEVVTKIAEDRETMIACVVDEEGVLRGIIRPADLLKAVELREFHTQSYRLADRWEALRLMGSRTAADIMSPPVSMREEDNIDQAIGIMLSERVCELPVVDDKGRAIGEINYFGIITSAVDYLKEG
jgi:CBS-domain-containing membrane protein